MCCLPPLDTHRAFEATARHESCAKAADELTVMCRAVACASSSSCWTEIDVPIKATAGMRI
jgi:hypothetical protein